MSTFQTVSTSTLQTDNNSLREELKELREKYAELIQKVNPTRIQRVEKPLSKSKISIKLTEKG